MHKLKCLLNGYKDIPMMDSSEERTIGEIKFTFCEKNDRKSAEEIFQYCPEMISQSFGAKESTNLHNAASRDRSSVVKFLLEKGAPRSRVDINGNTPLHIASVRGTCKTVELLLTPECVVKANIDGDYPIHVAAAAGNLPVVKLLIDYMSMYKDDINCDCEPHSCKSSEEDTPLHAAAQFGQVHVMQYLLACGAKVNARNSSGETPLHLAAGAKLRPTRPCHIQILLDHGATLDYCTNLGEPASFYAVRTGTVESFELLLNSGVPVRKKNKLNGNFLDEYSKSDSLLREVLNVGCEKKCRILLNKIMDSRYKIKAVEEINELYVGRRACLLNGEVTDQDYALSAMTKEILENPEAPESAMRAILDINSTVAGNLFDSCIRIDKQDDRPIYTKVIFDLFLFKHKTAESTVLDLIIDSGKLHLLQHPLIEIFIELKWFRTWKIFAFFIFFLVVKLFSFACYIIFEFGAIYFEEQHKVSAFFRWITLIITSIVIVVVVIEWIYFTANKIRNRKSRNANNLCNTVEIYNIITYLKELADPTLTLICMLVPNKPLASFALIISTNNFLGNISRIPRMGSHVFMSGKVFRTITEFFFSYIFVFLGYSITFHIALHDQGVVAFANMGDSLIKVMTMLLGEFDYTDNFVKSSDWTTRIFFVLFVVSMCIVLMNLIVGLAIGDIKKMRKNANVYKQIGTLSGIRICDEILAFFQNVPFLKKWIRQRRECNHFTVFLDLQEGRYSNSQMLYITDTKTKHSWSYGCSKETSKKVIELMKISSNEGDHSAETPHKPTKDPKDHMLSVVEKLDRKIENLENKIESILHYDSD